MMKNAEQNGSIHIFNTNIFIIYVCHFTILHPFDHKCLYLKSLFIYLKIAIKSRYIESVRNALENNNTYKKIKRFKDPLDLSGRKKNEKEISIEIELR